MADEHQGDRLGSPAVSHDDASPLVSLMKKGARFVPDGSPQLVPFVPSGWHSWAAARVSVKATIRHQLSSGPMYRPGIRARQGDLVVVAGHRDGLAVELARPEQLDRVRQR